MVYDIYFRLTQGIQHLAAWLRVVVLSSYDAIAYRLRGWTPTHYRDLLADHVADQVRNHGLVDFHVSQMDGLPTSPERTAKAVYETMTGSRTTYDWNEKTF